MFLKVNISLYYVHYLLSQKSRRQHPAGSAVWLDPVCFRDIAAPYLVVSSSAADHPDHDASV